MRFSTPVIASSSGEATVSAITFGFAPGYVAVTCTVGGTTSGYSLIGSSGSAIAPATKMMIDSTAAKIGRATKKREKFMASPPRLPSRTNGMAPRSPGQRDGEGHQPLLRGERAE